MRSFRKGGNVKRSNSTYVSIDIAGGDEFAKVLELYEEAQRRLGGQDVKLVNLNRIGAATLGATFVREWIEDDPPAPPDPPAEHP